MKGEVYIEVRDKNGKLKQTVKEKNKVFDNATVKFQQGLNALQFGYTFPSLERAGLSPNNFKLIGLFNETQDENTSMFSKLPEYVGSSSSAVAANKNGQLTKSISTTGKMINTWLFNITENTSIKSIALKYNKSDNFSWTYLDAEESGASGAYKNYNYLVKLNDGKYFSGKFGKIYDVILSGENNSDIFYKKFIDYKSISDNCRNFYLKKDKTKIFTVNNANQLLVYSTATYNIEQTIALPTPTVTNSTPFILKQDNFLYIYNGGLKSNERKIIFHKIDPTSPQITITNVELTFDTIFSTGFIDAMFVSGQGMGGNFAYVCADNIIFYLKAPRVLAIYDFNNLKVVDGRNDNRFYGGDGYTRDFTINFNHYDFYDDPTTIYQLKDYSILSTILNLQTPINLLAGDVLNIEYTIQTV
ncbi:MAG: hypothetical protein RR454_03140 [Clostridia bacterium]